MFMHITIIYHRRAFSVVHRIIFVFVFGEGVPTPSALYQSCLYCCFPRRLRRPTCHLPHLYVLTVVRNLIGISWAASVIFHSPESFARGPAARTLEL
jgi:hypothetical protein